MTHGKKFPRDVIELWPEIFGEISLNVIPIRYLDTITVKFKNNKIWEINLKTTVSENTWEQFEGNLKDILTSYESAIESVDFRLDTERIKRDIIKHTNKFLKKRKLK